MAMTKSVEQRWNERRSIQFEVAFTPNGQSPQPATCRDLGLGGMFVEADPQSFSINEQLDIGFTLAGTRRKSDHHLRARVVRVCAQGAGLMFSGFKLESVWALRDIIYDATRAPLQSPG